jgi:NADPH:quinone reductase
VHALVPANLCHRPGGASKPAGYGDLRRLCTASGPGLPEDQDYLGGLGAAEVLDRNGDIVAALRERYPDGVDALLDLVSATPEALNAYAAVVCDGGRIASSVGAAGQGPGSTNVSALPGPEPLERLAGLLEDGTLTVPIQTSYPLAQVDQALKALTGQHTQGKLAITVA